MTFSLQINEKNRKSVSGLKLLIGFNVECQSV